jgi:hypothetical protein
LSPANGPFIILFEQQSPDQADDSVLVGEDADHVAAPLDLAVEAFECSSGLVCSAAIWMGVAL